MMQNPVKLKLCWSYLISNKTDFRRILKKRLFVTKSGVFLHNDKRLNSPKRYSNSKHIGI